MMKPLIVFLMGGLLLLAVSISTGLAQIENIIDLSTVGSHYGEVDP